MVTPQPARHGWRAALPWRDLRGHLWTVAGFSACLNLLNLTPTIYTLQVYDRVLPTGHVMTLALLTLVTLGCLGAMALFEWLRARVLVRAAARLDSVLARPLLDMLLARPDLTRLDRAEGMRQLDTLRGGVGGPVVVALFDLPWAPLYVIAAFLLHPWLGALALFGCALMLVLAWHNERAVHGRTSAAEAAVARAHAAHAHSSAFAAEVRAMGLHEALGRRQVRERGVAKNFQTAAGFAAVAHSNVSRFMRIVLQTLATTLGAYLAVKGDISGGAVIAVNFLFARALAPIDQVVAGWRGIVATRNAAERITAILAAAAEERPRISLPHPEGAIAVERLTVLAPQSERIVLADVSFTIAPGEQIGVVGLSGAGKSTLLRALAGAIQPLRGVVRYDSVAYAEWEPRQITRAIGYLPQDFVLFPGTVKENISRFDAELGVPEAEIDAKVVAAACALGVHEAIARLPLGYATPIGTGGVGLSAGQSQRIALARALYGSPRILILDEPNAHLDAEAEQALLRLLSGLRAHKVTVIMAAHSADVLASMDKLLHLKNGAIVGFGPLASHGALGGRAAGTRPQPPAARAAAMLDKEPQ